MTDEGISGNRSSACDVDACDVPDLVGKNVADFADVNGVKLFTRFVEASNQEENAYVSYYWKPEGQTTAVEKIALCRTLCSVGMGHWKCTVCRR